MNNKNFDNAKKEARVSKIPSNVSLKHLKEPITPIRTINPDIPQSIENIITTATAKNSKNRYNNAREMHDDLLTCLNKERLNEPKRKLKYDEGIDADVAISKTNANMDNSIVSQIKDTDDDSNKKLIIFGGILVALVAILAIVFFLVPLFTEVPDVKIPDVSKWSVVEAENELKKLGFTVNADVIEEANKDIEKGKVVRTNPISGRTVKKGTEITLIVSTGELVYKVPDLTGKNYIEVKTELEKVYNLVVNIEEKEVENTKDKTYNEQEIVGQSVAKDSELTEGDDITLYIPKILERYPDLKSKGWSVDEIKEWASKKEIVLEVEYQETNEVKEGTVISQSRGTSSYITKGATLKVVIAKKKEEAQLPDDGSTNNNNNNNNKPPLTDEGN